LTEPDQKIGLALSGGGVRAMAFHCGVLRWLAETKRLETISQISSVSGGSLLIGQIFAINEMEWPSSERYLKHVHPQIKRLLTTTDLQSSAIKRLLLPRNWQYIFSRANVLSQTIEALWGVTEYMCDLPLRPEWSVNGTTAETGRRFRFERVQCGDYEVGYIHAADIKIADAMAVSAAFPIGIGPFVILWRKQQPPTYNSTDNPPYAKLHLYDGGVYDNLGLEPLFDIGSQTLKSDAIYLIVSDAGLALKREFSSGPLSPFRVKRIADILQDQTRSLRVRSLVNYLKTTPNSGVYVQIGADARTHIEKYRSKDEGSAGELLSYQWLELEKASIAAKYETTLGLLPDNDFDLIERHGYETTMWNEKLFC
jgi:NTE family protein